MPAFWKRRTDPVLAAALASIAASLARIESALQMSITNERATMVDLTQLTKSVANDTNVISSAETLIQGFAASQKELQQQLADAIAAGDPAALAAAQKTIDAQVAALDANDSALAAAVAANTIAAPAPQNLGAGAASAAGAQQAQPVGANAPAQPVGAKTS